MDGEAPRPRKGLAHLAELKAQGYLAAVCPKCRIIFSLSAQAEVERLEREGCGICNGPKQTDEAKQGTLKYD